MLLVVGDVAEGGVIIAGVVRAAEGDAHVAAVVASAAATYKVPVVLHTSSALTPSACCSLWATLREVTRIAGDVLATEIDALFTAIAETAGATHKAADMLVGSSVVGRPNRWGKLVVRFTTVSLGARRC